MQENPKAMRRICLGGSFNPVHHGHLLCARAATESLGAQDVVLVVSRIAPHKQRQSDLASAADRLEMCRLAVADATGFEVDDREIRRGGPSYTIDTVRQLKQSGWDEVIWLIGADLLAGLPTWHQPQALLAEARVMLMARPGWSFDWSSLPPAFQVLRQQTVQVPQIDISATEIRRRVAAGQPIEYLTPPGVCRYIQDHGLYR